MIRNQRTFLLLGGVIVLLGTGRLLFFGLGGKPAKEIATSIQGELTQEDTNEKQAQQIVPLEKNGQKTNKKIVTPITILLPPWENQEHMNILLSRLDSEKRFSHTIIQPETFNSYLRALDVMTKGDRQADIILLPRQEFLQQTDRAAEVDRGAGHPAGLFHPQISHLITDTTGLFIPHALDPRVTLTLTPTKNLTLGTFLQQYRSPLQFVSGGDTIATHQRELIALWLDQLLLTKNNALVSKLFLPATTPSCTMQVACLYEGAGAIRLPVSSITQKDLSRTSLSLFPSVDNKVPTTVRGWAVRGNDAPVNIQERLLWIQNYLNIVSNDQLPYEDPLLPAYFPRFERLMLQDDYAWLRSSMYKLAIIPRSHKQLQERLSSTLPFSSLLDGSYRVELYLEKWQEISIDNAK